jgi:exonuclease SbcC
MSRRLLPIAMLALACATTPAGKPAGGLSAAVADPATRLSQEARHRADADRVRALELEVERLRADLRAAEETLLSVESGMRGEQGRAEAISALAEARIELARAARRAPWREDVADEARDKLTEAERQLAADHVGSAVFFVSRARRMAESLAAEADRVAADPKTRFVREARVNLRGAPTRDAEVLATLPAQLPVFVETHEGDWVLVRTVTGNVGFLRSDLLSGR